MKKILFIFISCLISHLLLANIQLLKNNFNKSIGAWTSPNYWGGKISHITQNNRKYLQLTSTTKGKKDFARSYGYCKQIRFFPDMLIKIKLKVKGQGKFNTGLLLYSLDNDNNLGYLRSKEITLSNNFQSFETILKLDQCFGKILPLMEIQGKGFAIVESFTMEAVKLPNNSITCNSKLQIIDHANLVKDISFTVNTSNKKFYITEINGKNVVTFPQDGNGKISFKPQNLLPGLNEIILSSNGVSSTVYVEVSNQYAIDEAIAKKISFDKKVSCLFLGDSLTEYYPGKNYFARLEFWLNKFNQNKVTLTNAGVGGDFITRVAQRMDAQLTKKGQAYRQKMYQGIFEKEYDYIFIWLGHNDTVTSRISKYGKFARPQVTPDVQEKTYTHVINTLKKLNPKAKIILISPSPSDVNKFISYDKRFKANQQIHMFGKKEFVAAFDAVNRKLVKKFNLGYVEMNKAMSSIPNIASLYVADGVHLSTLGGQIASREILKAFANNFSNIKQDSIVTKIPITYVPEYDLSVKLTGNNFNKSLHGWNSPNYWPGKVNLITVNSKKLLQLTSGKRGQEEFARAHGYCKNISLYPETVIQIKVRVKGEGKFNAGIICYPWKSKNPGNYLRTKKITLSKDFKYLTSFLVLPEKYEKILPIMEVQGKGVVQVEFFEMHTCIDKKVKLKTLSNMQIVKNASDAKEVAFATVVPSGKLTLSITNSKGATVSKIAAKDKLTIKPKNLLPNLNEIAISSSGQSASTFIDVNSQYNIDNAIAQKIKINKSLNILFIGGSHCEFYPGQNFISRLNSWLNKYNPNKVNIFNYGVAGDFITRVEQRLNSKLKGTNPAWRQYMYETIFDRKYDYIFMFLGQNDTVTSRISKYGKFARPQVTPDVQEKAYRNVLNIFKEQSPKAKIVIMTPSPSYVKRFEDYDKRFKANQQIHMFGKKEFLDAYVKVNQKLAKEFNLDTIDTLNVMRQYPQIRALYVEDGVHLTPLGGMIVSREVLKYFAKKFPANKIEQPKNKESKKAKTSITVTSTQLNIAKTKENFPIFDEDLTFYHSFDNSVVADLSSGKGNPINNVKKAKYLPGLHKSALFCGKNGGSFLRFQFKDNINFDQPGTLVFFYKPLNWEKDKDKKYPRLFWWGIDSAKGYLGLQGANDPKNICMCQRQFHIFFLYGKRIPSKSYVLPPLGKDSCLEKWHMLAFSWAGNKLYLKWNNQKSKQLDHHWGIKNSDFPSNYFSFGSGANWNYLLDDFMIYSRRLTDNELDELYNCALK